MVLNPVLYDTLRAHVGHVRVSDENSHLMWEWDKTASPPRPKVQYAGEQYYVCCPVCGDTRYRLAIGHRWMTPLHRIHSPSVMRHNYRCYNEDCVILEHPKIKAVMADITQRGPVVDQAVERLSSMGPTEGGSAQLRTHPLPVGFTLLEDLPADHRAHDFVRRKYGFDPVYLSRGYRVGYSAAFDPAFPKAFDRVIFPIFHGGELLSWQGRAVNPDEPTRWLFPGGARKVLYNWDLLPLGTGDVVVITEGIPAAIASGPSATAIFGKELEPRRCADIAQNFRTAVIATDPETQFPDPMSNRRRRGGVSIDGAGRIFAEELRDNLIEAGMRTPPIILPYPAEVTSIARAASKERLDYVAGHIPKPAKWLSVPDPADIGLTQMQVLLRALPVSHRPRYLC